MKRQVRLEDLIRSIPRQPLVSVPEISINGIALDSRKVQPGNLFVALVGANTDGHCYIPEAIKRGAAAICGMKRQEALPKPYIYVEDSRQTLAYLSAAFYGYPSRRLTVI